MGFLTEGKTLGLEETKEHNFSEEVVQTTKVNIDARSVVKRDGLKQLVNILRTNTPEDHHPILLWGDEVEMTCVDIPNCMNQPPRLWMGAYDLVDKLQKLEKATDEEWKSLCINSGNCPDPTNGTSDCDPNEKSYLDYFSVGSAWHPEMSRHMIEALPDPPYAFSGKLDGCVLGIEESMNARRRKVQCLVPSNVVATTITAFPAMGGFEPGQSPGWISPADANDVVSQPGRYTGSPSSRSRFIPDDIANPHPRFPTLVENVRLRREGAYKILIPVYQDTKTSEHPMWRLSLPEHAASNRQLVNHAAMLTPNPIKNHIYMDSFPFGMGTSCLQMTMGCHNMEDARHLYDQYTVLAPLVLALSASTPAYRGLLADTDTRWSTLEQACDCRTADEEDPNSPNHIPKSRYSGVSLYISNNELMQKYDSLLNDALAPVNDGALKYLTGEGVDEILARHFAHLWIREPLVIYDNAIFIDNHTRNDHFENIQSTNWNSVRFKPPPPGESTMPYRVELRTAEIQLTDFENAAMSSFAAMFARACIDEKWELYIPMTKNDENMKRSWERDAVVQEKFWFRTNIEVGSTLEMMNNNETLFVEMSMHEIIGGHRGYGWPGLVSMVMAYASAAHMEGNISRDALRKFSVFCELMKARASGEVPTCARYLRNIMTNHLHYNQDSVITPSMASRAMTAAALVGAGVFWNDVSSVKPHLGRFVLDVKPLYQTDKTSRCILKKLRERVFEYEGLDGGRTPMSRVSTLSTTSFTKLSDAVDSTEETNEGSSSPPPVEKGSCRLQFMIESGQKSMDGIDWNDKDCSIHGVEAGRFVPTTIEGEWKASLHKNEWIVAHRDDEGRKCHMIFKQLLEYGADLSKLSKAGFPCAGTDEPPQQKFSTICGSASPGGPFMSTNEAKEKLWAEFAAELEHPEQTPLYKLRRRELESRLQLL